MIRFTVFEQFALRVYFYYHGIWNNIIVSQKIVIQNVTILEHYEIIF